MTLVSVYITNYNYEKYLTQAIESVLFQTYKNIELIIIDDGSQDRSKLIIESYADYPNIKIIFQKNKGLNVTNNIAMKVANGKYIMRLDADDYLVDTAIEEMVSLLEADENLGLVFPDYYLVDVDNTKTAEIQRFDFDTEVSLFDLPAHGACTMIRLDFLKRLGGYDESYTCQDGYELWIKFVTKYRVTNISKPLFYYRQHGENLTSNEDKILNTRIKIKKDFLYKNKIQTPETLAIIPIRNTKIGNKYLAFTKIGNERIIDIKIRTVLESDLVSKVVVTSHNQEFLDYINKEYFGNVRVVTVLRPMSFARLNESLNNTINLVLANPKCLIDEKGGFVVLPLEYPFLNSNEIDDTIRTSVIFKADTVISVRVDNSTFYKHDGNGMRPILNQNNFTKLEREDLFKATGGVTFTMLKAYRTNKKMISGKVGHVVVSPQTNIGVFSKFDVELAKSYYAISLSNQKLKNKA